MTTTKQPQFFAAGDKVTTSGFPGRVVRTRNSPGSSWMGGMIEVRLASGVVCVCSSDVEHA